MPLSTVCCRLSTVLWLLVMSSISSSQGISGGDASAFLRSGVGAKAIGLGGAYVSIADDASGAFWNPAGLIYTQKRQVSETYRSLSLDRKENVLSYSQRSEQGAAFGFMWIYAGTANIQGRDINGRKTGEISDNRNAFYFSFAKDVDGKGAIGLNGKYLRHSLAGEAGRGFGFDVGAMVKPTEDLSIGFVVRNINTELSWKISRGIGEVSYQDEIPESLVVGASYRFFDERVLISFDVERSNGEVEVRSGWELALNEFLRLRAGVGDISSDDIGESSQRFGIGLGPIFERQIDFQYVFITDQMDAGGSHVFSTALTF